MGAYTLTMATDSSLRLWVVIIIVFSLARTDHWNLVGAVTAWACYQPSSSDVSVTVKEVFRLMIMHIAIRATCPTSTPGRSQRPLWLLSREKLFITHDPQDYECSMYRDRMDECLNRPDKSDHYEMVRWSLYCRLV